MDVRAVLFDLDGVLIDSFSAWFAAVNDVASRFGVGPFGEGRVLSVWGQGVAADAENLYPGHTPEEIRRAYDEALPRHVRAVALNPEARPVLDALRGKGIGRAVVTNTQTSLAHAILRAKGIADAVDVVAALEPGVREKPSPDLLIHALEGLRIPPTEALMVGDTRYDEQAALAAGVRFVRYDFSKGERLASALGILLDGPLPTA
jgi:HAD superfamily hydrolase (TIGR01509 family)